MRRCLPRSKAGGGATIDHEWRFAREVGVVGVYYNYFPCMSVTFNWKWIDFDGLFSCRFT